MRRNAHRIPDREVDRIAADWIVRRNFGLNEQEAREFQAWVNADRRHAAALTEQSLTWSLLDRPRAAGYGEWMARELASRAARRRRRHFAATASVACSVVLLLGVWQRQPPPGETGGHAGARAPVVAAPESRDLADGSKVELRPGAEIAVEFSESTRRVALRRGTAHFEVTHNPERPFIVEAGSIRVRAVGTAFSVEITDSNVEIIVTHGRIAVDERNTGSSAPAVTLPTGAPPVATPSAHPENEGAREFAAGSHVVVSTTQLAAIDVSVLSEADLSERLAWRSPRVEFTDTPLVEAVEVMNRYGESRIRIVSPALGRTAINGLFRADNTETFIELLELSFNAKATRVGQEILVDLVADTTRR